MDMTAKLSIIISSKENVLTVPYAAVQTAEDGSFYVEVVDENAGADAVGSGQPGGAPGGGGNAAMPSSLPTRRIPVTKGIESDYYVEISGEGIEEGLEVIVPADDSLDDLSRLLEQMGPMGGF